MSGIHEMKRQEEMETPLLLFECTLSDGSTERWSTHRVTADGFSYEPRVLRHGGFEMRLGGEEAVDLGARFTLTVSNVDRRVSQLDGTVGWRGARLRVRFGFFDVTTGQAATELTAVFLGIANPVEELTEREARLSFTNRLSLQRLQVPAVRIQSRCPWRFPTTAEERGEAAGGGAEGPYSPLYRCGYSAGVEGGVGNLSNGEPFTACKYTRDDCALRGMLRKDSEGRETARFGGFAFLPPSILVRAHGAKETAQSDAVDGRGRANDAVPLVYGTAWINAPVIFARNDGNLTHCEALIGLGPMEGIQKVIANGVELPLGEDGKDMTATGWYNVLSLGGRNGGFNLEFQDGAGNPAGDPHGSMACLAVVVPNQVVQAGRLPKVEALVDGRKLPRYGEGGEPLGESFTRNPAWILLDLFRQSGWTNDEIDIISFAKTAAYCDEFIPLTTPEGQTVEGPRFEINLPLTQRRSLSEIVRGIRTAAGLMISVGEDGRVRLAPETKIARQEPVKRASSNSVEPLAGGWPAYEFGDGSNGFSGILKSESGGAGFRIFRRASSEMPNRISCEFQDAFNQYQTDSLSLVDYEDAALQGYEISAQTAALGLPHFDQAARILRLQIEKNLQGNHFVEFETSVQALGLRPGDVIAVTHRKEAMERAPYRILKISPALNFERARIVAQRHMDEWYEKAAGEWQVGTQESGRSVGAPRPLAGKLYDAEGAEQYGVEETAAGAGGAGMVELTVKYTPPGKVELGAPAAPVVDLTPVVDGSGGTLKGGQTVYYAVTGVDSKGAESRVSMIVAARLAAGVDTYSVKLKGIRLGKGSGAMRVYRGESPGRLRRIADNAVPGSEFTDTGLAATLAPPPDANFDHARFQWRFELLPETAADLYGAAMIGSSTLGLLPDEFRGCAVRIMRGPGAGQERIIASHTSTEITLTAPWRVAAGPGSTFVIAEAGWKPAGITTSGDVRFLVAAGAGGAVQVEGVASSANGAESNAGEAIVTRHEPGGAAAGDADVPGMPDFGLTTSSQGGFEVGGIGFASLENTRTIRTGTLTVHYWDELQSPSPWSLASGCTEGDWVITVGAGMGVEAGDLIQVEAELIRVLEVRQGGVELLVDRGSHETPAAPHGAGTKLYPLRRHTSVLAFAKNFFGSAASGSYSQFVDLKNARIAAAEFFVTNDRGSSPTSAQAYTLLVEGGLRTMSGGQYSIQYDGELAVMAAVAPSLIVEARRAVRDVRAFLEAAPIGEPVQVRVWADDQAYADLSIAPGSKSSNVTSRFDEPPLGEGAQIRVEILSVGTAAGSYPGRNLTVTLRL